MIKNKRGLSGVVTAMILILLSLVAVGIIWVVIQNLISKGAEDISIGRFTLDLKIEKVLATSTGIDVTVKRNPGQGELTGLKFITSDGTNSETFEQKNIQINELETKTFNLPYAGIVKEISVAPIDNKGSVGSVVNTLKFTSEQAVKNIQGLVSWWRFDGNPNDEVGGNNGIVSGATLTTGKFGQAYGFRGTNVSQDYINISRPGITNTSDFTLAAWIKPYNSTQNYHLIIRHWGYNHLAWIKSTREARLGIHYFNGVINVNDAVAAPNFTEGQWNFVSVTKNGNDFSAYVNGVLGQSKIISGFDAMAETLTNDYKIGYSNAYTSLDNGLAFNGTIDEIMIFNRALNAEEIQAIYNLDLS